MSKKNQGQKNATAAKKPNPAAASKKPKPEAASIETVETAAPETAAPEATSPEAAAPEATSPEAAAPEATSSETLIETLEEPKQDPVEEALKLIADRPVLVFWHKACDEAGKTTKTTLYAKETLRPTTHKKTLTNPEYKSAEETPDVSPTIIKDVYSLKRGKRIYYLTDVTPLDVTKALRAKAAEDAAKKAETEAAAK